LFFKKCIILNESLLKTLLVVDGITGSQEIRIYRKGLVADIQNVIDSVDLIQEKLRKIEDERKLKDLKEIEEKKLKEEDEKRLNLEQQRAKEEENRKLREIEIQKLKEHQKMIELKRRESKLKIEEKERERLEQLRQERLRKEQQKRDEELRRIETNNRQENESFEPNTKNPNIWTTMKFKPSFQSKNYRDKYIFEAYMPGLNKKSLNINVKNNLLNISGYTEPTEKDKKVFRDQIRRKNLPINDENLYLQFGGGHFGKFEESFELGSFVDEEKIRASYNDGYLTLIIPKRQNKFPSYSMGDLFFSNVNIKYV